MADLVSIIVDPGEGGGYDYSSLDAWEDALGGTTSGNLVNDDEIAQALCRSSGGTDDTTAVAVNGWTTDATRYIEIKGTDFPDDGIYADTEYVLATTDAVALSITEENVRVTNLQVFSTVTADNGGAAIYTTTGVSAGHIIIDSCILKGAGTGDGSNMGYRTADGSITSTIKNCIIYGFKSDSDEEDGGFCGVYSTGTKNLYLYNCTIYSNNIGIYQNNDPVTAKNCAIFNNFDDISGTVTLGNCATDNGDDSGNNGNITITQSADDWAALVTDAAGGDFSVTDADSQLYDAGEADVFAEDDDIMDTARPQGDHWDIGAFEFIVGPPSGNDGIMTTWGGYWGATY